ncbi:hypothetical protein J6590_039709 [Homalodisca vitripennis]|nr:hypothetical protein J6590_039709 [Homalodisca vitripennis]
MRERRGDICVTTQVRSCETSPQVAGAELSDILAIRMKETSGRTQNKQKDLSKMIMGSDLVWTLTPVPATLLKLLAGNVKRYYVVCRYRSGIFLSQAYNSIKDKYSFPDRHPNHK